MIKNCIDALIKARARAKIPSTGRIPILEASIDDASDEHANFVRALRESLIEDCYNIFFYHEVEGTLDFEEELSRNWDEFESLASAEWAEIRSIVDASLAGTLLIYSMRMSTLAVRGGNPRRLRDAVMGLVVDTDLLDSRDIIVAATLAYDAATRIGADPEQLLRASMKYATPARKNLLDEYLRGPSFTKSIRSMGFDAVETELGFVYSKRRD